MNNEDDPLCDPAWHNFVGLFLARIPGMKATMSKHEVMNFETTHHGKTIVLRATDDFISLELVSLERAKILNEKYDKEMKMKALRKVN